MDKFVKLKNVCIRITDGSHYSPIGVEEGFPMLSVKDMRENGFDYSDCKFISKADFEDLVRNDCKPLVNDILIAKDGSYLKHVFVNKNEIEQAVLSSIGILRPNLNSIVPQYLKYYLQTKSVKETVAKKYVSGSALPRIILKNFGEIDILYPIISTQQKIASILSTLDDKIEINNQINDNLEQMAKTLYDYWFVQFDFPNAEGKPYKSSGGEMVYNEVLKREIPRGWEVKKIEDILSKSVKKYNINSSSYELTGAIPIVDQSTDFVAGYTSNLEAIVSVANGPKIVFGDHTRILKFINFDFARGADGTQVLESTFKNMPPHLFYQALSKIDLSNYGYARHFKFLKDHKIVMPNENTSTAFENIAILWYEKIKCNRIQNQELASLRDWLLPMLMNGQVRVAGAYEDVEVLRQTQDDKLGMVAEDASIYQINNNDVQEN